LWDIAAKLDHCGLFKSEIIARNVEQKHARQNQYLYMSHKIPAVARALPGIGDVTLGTQRRSANRKSKRDQLGAVAGSRWLAGKLSFCKTSFSRRPISDRIFQSPPPAVFRGNPAIVAIAS